MNNLQKSKPSLIGRQCLRLVDKIRLLRTSPTLPKDFDWEMYLALNQDLAEIFGSTNREAAIRHFLEYGIKEDRPYTCQVPINYTKLPKDFNWRLYLEINPDVVAYFGAENRMMAIQHFLNHGISENRCYKREFKVTPPKKGRYPKGVNISGFINSTVGLGNACRSLIRQLQSHNIPHVLNDLPLNVGKEKHFKTKRYSLYDTNIICCNPDYPFLERLGPEYLAKKRNIGLWFWELETVPKKWIEAAEVFDEIWVQSRFCKEVFQNALPDKTIRYLMPDITIPPTLDTAASKTYFGFNPGHMLFLFMFDVHSDLYRKNPLGLIQAFKLAFPDHQDVRLVIKAHNMKPDIQDIIDTHIAGDSRITTIFESFSSADRDTLLAACDVYVSLHRSEGLGLTLLEAILMGKPLICTGRTGNMDFCDPRYVDLIDGETVSVDEDSFYRLNYEYPENVVPVWTEPDLNQAAKKMRETYGNLEVKQKRVLQNKAQILSTWESAIKKNPLV